MSEIGNNASFDAKLVGSVISRDKWNHVAAVKSGNRYTLYLNGTNVASGNYTLAPVIRAKYTIGAVYFTSNVTENFKGEIDEVRLWNIARLQNDIRDYMCKKVQPSYAQFSNLQSYYRFDSPNYTNDLVYDQSTSTTTGITQNIRFTERSSYTVSGAPIGDISKFLYTSNWNGAGVSFNHPDGDMVAVFNIGNGNPEGVHVYYTNQGSYHNYTPLYYEGVTDNKYFGVFMVGGTNPDYDLSYIYSGNPQAKIGADENQHRLLKKCDASDDKWVHSGAKLNLANHSLAVLCKENYRSEYTLAFRKSNSINRPGPGLALHSSMPSENENDGGFVDFLDFDDYTVTFWAKGSGFILNMSGRYGWGDEFFSINEIGGGAVRAFFRIGALAMDVSFNMTAGRIDEWIHYAVTRKGTRITVYVNGKVVAEQDFTNSTHYQSMKFLDPPYWYPNTDVSVDEFTLWNVALDQETIRDWMCKKITADHPNECKNLVLYFNFEEGQGTVVEDKNGSSDLILIPRLTYVTSGAAVGDESIHDYNTPNDISFSHPDGDFMEATKTSAEMVDGVHLYRVDNSIPNPSNVGGSSINSMDSSRYWGIYIADRNTSSIPEYEVKYHFENNRMINPGNEDELRLLSRIDRTDTPWNDNPGVIPNIVNNTLTLTNQPRGEYVLGGTTTTTFIGDCSPTTPVFMAEAGTTNASIICGNATGLVYRVIPDPMVETYIWTLPNGLSGFSTSDSINITAELGYESPPAFSISVVGVNNCGHSLTATYDVTINPSPTLADAGPDLMIFPPILTATMDGNAVSGGETGTWRLGLVGNGTITNANDPLTTITSIQSGNNYFVWEINNGSCSPSTDTVKIIVAPPPVRIIDANSGEIPIEVCSDNIYTFEAIPPEDITPDGYVWNLPTGMSIVGQTGEQVQVMVNSGFGGVIEVSSVYSGVPSDPYVSNPIAIRTTPVTPTLIQFYDTICLKTTNTYQAISHPSIDRYEWSFPGGVYHTVYPEPSDYEVDLIFEEMIEGYIKVQAFNGTCTSENAKDSAHFVVMEAPPSPPIPDMYGHTQEWAIYILCKPDSNIMWVVNDMPGATYNWTLPESVLATPMNDNSSAMVIDADDIYYGTIYVTRTIGEGVCNTSAPVDMRIIASTESADVEATSIAMISAGDPMDLQVGMTYDFEAYGGANYYWMLPDGVIRTDTLGNLNETDATITLYVEREFTGYLEVWALYRGGCVRNKKRIALCSNSTGNCLLPPDFISGTTEFCQGGNLNITVSNIAAADEYVWTMPDGTEYITLTNTIDQQMINAMIGTVEVYVRNAFGESTPGAFYIRVMPVVMDPIEFIDQFGDPINEREICEGNSYNPIFVRDVGANDYTWDITAGIIMWNPKDGANGYRLDPKTSGTDTSILVKFVDWWANANPSPGYVTVIVSNGCGTPVRDSIYYFLATPASRLVPNFTDIPTSVCVGSKVTYKIDPIERVDQYFWSVPSGLVASVLITDVPEITVDVTQGTGGVVTVYASLQTCGGGNTITQESEEISIVGTPVDFDFIDAPLAGCPGNTLIYSVNDVKAADYTWNLPTGLQANISGTTIQVDNNDPECEISGNWNPGSDPELVNGDYISRGENVGVNNYVLYRPNILVAGTYKVYWSFYPNDNASRPTVDIQTADNLYSMIVNQRIDNGILGHWTLLGEYEFEQRTSGFLRLNTYTSANWANFNTDAVKFVASAFTLTDTLLQVNVIGDGDGALCVSVDNKLCESGYTVCTDPINLGDTLDSPTIVNQENAVCEGQDYEFSVSDIGADTYTWYLPTGMSIGGQTNVVTGLTRTEIVTMDLNTGAPVQVGVSGVINSCSVFGDTVYTNDITFSGSGCQLADPVFITTVDTTCGGIDLTFTILPVVDAEQYQWILPIDIQENGTGLTGIVYTTVPTIIVTPTNTGDLGEIMVSATAPLSGIASSNQVSTINPIVVVSVPNFSVSTIDLSSCTSTDGLITVSGLNPFTTYSLSYSYEGTPQALVSFTTDNTGLYNLADQAGGEYTLFEISLGTCSTVNPGTYTISANLPVVTLGALPDLCENDTAYTLLGGLPTGGTAVSLGKFDPVAAGEGTHTITYEYTEGPGCTNSVTSTITVKPLPSGSLGSDNDVICIGSPVTYTANGGDSYIFTLNGIVGIETNTTGTYTNSNPSDGDLVGVEVTLNGCIANYTETTISVVPLPTRSLVSTHDTICEGVKVSFTASGGVNYNFIVNGVIVTSTTINTLISSTLNNEDVITAEIIDVNGCVRMANDTIVMEIIPAPTSGITGSLDLCPGVVGIPYEADSLANVLYDWDVTGSDNYISIDYRHLEIDWGIGSEGNIDLVLLDTITGCSSSSSITITLFDAGAPVILNCPENFEVEAEIENGVWHYILTDADSVKIPLVQEDCESTGYTLNFSLNDGLAEDERYFVGTELLVGLNKFVWIAKDHSNNESESCVIEVSMIVNENIPSAFSPNGDGINDTWEMPFLQLYDNCIVKVFNRQGKIVFESKNGYSQAWDGSSFGRRLAVDSYQYIIITNNENKPRKGVVTIIQ